MPTSGAGEPEHIVCDTSVVSLLLAAASAPERIAHWPHADRERLRRGILTTTVFTLGEVRCGYVRNRWGAKRIQHAERALASYLLLPMDFAVLSRHVELRSRHLNQMGDNDMWIAATASARGFPVATCDLDFCRLTGELDVFYLPRDPKARLACPT